MPKAKLRVFIQPGCGPCQAVKEAIEAGHYNAEEIEVINIESKEGIPYIKKFGLTKAPSAYLGKQECELFINREDNSLFIECPDKGKSPRPPQLPERVAEPS